MFSYVHSRYIFRSNTLSFFVNTRVKKKRKQKKPKCLFKTVLIYDDLITAVFFSGWIKYSQNTAWCTSAGRSLISTYVNIIQCQRYCEARVGCNAIEYWEGGSRYCYECTDTSKITSYKNTNDWAYPVYVWIKRKLTGRRVVHLFCRHDCNTREIQKELQPAPQRQKVFFPFPLEDVILLRLPATGRFDYIA